MFYFNIFHAVTMDLHSIAVLCELRRGEMYHLMIFDIFTTCFLKLHITSSVNNLQLLMSQHFILQVYLDVFSIVVLVLGGALACYGKHSILFVYDMP